jgi:transposase
LDGEGRAINELRNEAIVQLKAEGKSTKQIAELFGLSQRTVQRIIAKGRGNS